MIKQIINLSQNENLYGFPDRILQKENGVLNKLDFITYRKKSYLRYKLSKKHKVKIDNIFLETGAEGALHEIFVNLSCLPNSKILLSDILWDYYKQLAKLHNIHTAFYRISENKKKNSYEFDLIEIKNAIKQKKPTAVIINNPHNPTGHQLPNKELGKFLKSAGKKTIIILDETYFGFSGNDDNRGSLIKQHPNLVVIRSFSKFYALAGVRIGYLLIGNYARKKLNIYAPYLGYNFIAEETASMVLDETEFYQSTKKSINKQRNILYNYFYHLKGFQPYKSVANFLLIRINSRLCSHIEYAKYLEDNGYKIKLFTEGKLKNCIRIAVPPKEHIEKIIKLTDSFVSKNMSRILVMGGTQFVSKAVAKYFIQKGHTVDIFTRGNIAVDYDGINQHIKGDRRNKNFVKKSLANKQYNFVIDISAYMVKDVEILIPHLNKDSLKKYIFISSGAVYNKPISLIHKTLFEENWPTKLIPHPTWGNYGLEKKKTENYIMAQSKKGLIECVIVRPPYIYGMGNNLLREKFYFSRIESGQPVLIPANTKTRIQFINIDDLCIFLEECLTNAKAADEVYNVAYPAIITWRALLDSVMKACGKKVKIYDVSNEIEPNARLYSPFRDEDMAFDTSKSVRHGFSSPEINLDEGLSKAYNFFLNEKKNKGSNAFKDPKMTRLDEISALIK